MFGVQKIQVFGTYGEFSVGSDDTQVRAQFLLTKMKPGTDGSWESELASYMVPWRKIFGVEDVSFDELLQRDLDDSRVAHDLIPYLLGEKVASARFFPPILAVIVPKKTTSKGILPYYPQITKQSEDGISFGDLFDFEKVKWKKPKVNDSDDEELVVTPLGTLNYNRQKSAFIIVDGQHRAMAILALHQIVNGTVSTDGFDSFYKHISILPEHIKGIELPVCIVFFPDLHEGNQACKDAGIDLKKVCREIFLIVNKTAKKVSESRQLLLDDDDFAARMMRNTLSKLKDRGESEASISRIYSFAFGDGDSELGKQVVSGQLEYSSAALLYKMHCAVAFGMPDAFNFEEPSDITDLRRAKNSSRPIEILRGTALEKWNHLSRSSAKYHAPQDSELAVKLLSDISDIPLLKLFDEFKPFSVHNAELRALRTSLLDPDARANLVQSKCYSLLFEGSGVRSVFEDHYKRLQEKQEELREEGKSLNDYIKNQLNDASAVLKALTKHERDIKEKRAARFFNINYDRFFSSEGNEEQKAELLEKAKSVFDTISTQAFQLGYLMTVHSVVELILEPNASYEKRIEVTKFVSSLYISALNTYFASGSSTEHYSLTGLVKESRANVFSTNQLGLRGLLAQSVKELNEKQWVFFRYAILEIVHSRYVYKLLKEKLDSADSPVAEAYKQHLPSLIESVLKLRTGYIEKAVQSLTNSAEFKREVEMLKVELRAREKSDDEITEALKEKLERAKNEVYEKCKQNIKASLGELLPSEKIVNRFIKETSDEGFDDVEQEIELSVTLADAT